MLFVVVNCGSYGIVYVVQLNIENKKKVGDLYYCIMECLYERVNTEDLFLFCSFCSFHFRNKQFDQEKKRRQMLIALLVFNYL